MRCISPAFYMYAVSDLTQKCYPTLQMFFGGGSMKHTKLWDSISTILVLFGLGLYGGNGFLIYH